MNDIALWILAFVLVFAADAAWASYIKACQDNRTLRACCWSVAIYLTGAAAVIGYVNDPWLLIPSCLGAWAGTWVGLKWPAAEEGAE